MTKDIERFEEVFKKSIQTMHEVNVKQFGSAMANIMLPALEQMKPIFKIVYEQGVTDGYEKLEGCVVVPSNSVTLTCEQLLTVLQYGAPDLHVERTEYSEEQMETEMSIVWLEDGHSGKGYYAYYTELPEEGSIHLDLMVEAARGGNE